jgi:hypothetical protein
MRFRATVLAAILVALILPGPVSAASPFASTVIRDVCTKTGGEYGHGFIVLKIGAVEFGKSGANYMVFRARLQERTNGRWVTVDASKWRTDTFANDTTSWSWWYRARWAFPSDRPLTRIAMRVRFFNERPGTDILLGTHWHVGRAC